MDSIAIVFCSDLKYCPYMSRYIEILERNKIEFKVYFWNRSGLELKLPANYKCYNVSSKLNLRKLYKAIDFYKFRRWIIRELKKTKPQKIIILSTLTGVILEDYLREALSSYIFDIRDYSYEYILPFFYLEKRVIENSHTTVISSPGFKEFLPNSRYLIAHNFNRNDIKKQYYFKKNLDEPISFVWNGVMRFFDYQRMYINALKNDERFNIVYHGDGPEMDKFIEYCSVNNIRNVILTGSYVNSDKERLLSHASIINNCYGYVKNPGNKLKYAISNRFYDGIIYHIPQAVEPVGYKTDLVLMNSLGVNYSADKNFADLLYEYYSGINSEEFDRSCDKVLKSVINDDDVFIEKLEEFFNM